MKVSKLVLCILLSLALVVTFVPMISFAQDEGADLQEPEEGVLAEETVVPDDIDFADEEADVDVAEDSEMNAKESSTLITSATVTIKAPICGTVMKGDFLDQRPQPEGILPNGANYEFGSTNGVKHLVWTEKTDFNYFQGTINGGAIYYAYIELRPKSGFLFSQDCQFSAPSGTVVMQYNDGDSVALWIPVKAGWDKSYVKKMKVKKGKKSFTVKWKKQSKKNLKKFNGYQIRYSTKADMSDAKIKNVSKKKKSKKIKKLAKKTKYYVQMRSYTKTSVGTLYSQWSKVKKVKTK